MIAYRPYRRFVGQVRHTLVGGPPGDEDHNIWNWYISTALIGVIDGGLYTFLPIYLARLGASAALLGLYNSLPALLSIVLVIPAGVLVERVTDQMRGMVHLALVARALTLVLILSAFFVPAAGLPLFIVILWALRTVPDAGAMPLWISISARAVSPARRAHVNGTRWALLSATSAICLVAFGRWLDAAHVAWAYEAVFITSLAASLFELGFFARLRVPLLTPQERPAAWVTLRQRLQDYLQPLSEHRPFVRYLAATFGYRVALSMPLPLYTLLWVRELKASDGLIGLRGTVTCIAFMLGYLLWGRSANRLGHRRLLRACALGGAGYVIASALVPSAGWLPVIAVLWGLSASGIDVGFFDLLLHACPPGKETRFASVATFGANLTIFVGPLLGVALANATSVRVALIAAGLLQLAAGAAFVLLPRDV